MIAEEVASTDKKILEELVRQMPFVLKEAQAKAEELIRCDNYPRTHYNLYTELEYSKLMTRIYRKLLVNAKKQTTSCQNALVKTGDFTFEKWTPEE